MLREYYRDFYGCTASIKQNSAGAYRVVVRLASGRKVKDTTSDTYRGARAALGRFGLFERRI